MDKYETIEQLVDIRDEIARLLDEADSIVRSEFPHVYENARSYWLAHMKCALGGYGYPTYSTTMLSCLEGLEESLCEDEFEEA